MREGAISVKGQDILQSVGRSGVRRLTPATCFALLTDKAADPFAGVPETGDRVTQAFAASLTAGMDRRIYLAGRVIYCRDWAAAEELERVLMVEVSKIAARERWKLDRPGRIRNLCSLAIIEECDPAFRVIEKHGARTGMQRAQARALWTQLSSPAWSRTWGKRYVAVRQILNSWKDAADSHVKRAQRD